MTKEQIEQEIEFWSARYEMARNNMYEAGDMIESLEDELSLMEDE